jgi:hypothetical protein
MLKFQNHWTRMATGMESREVGGYLEATTSLAVILAQVEAVGAVKMSS